MPANTNLLVLLASILAVIYPFWPLILLSALASRLRHPLQPMLVAWAVMLVCWICAHLVAMPGLLRFIPEPVNTALFFAAGTLIVGLFLLRKPLRLNL